jgi:lipopolysaccharide biosynthesis regulator YciM
LQQEDLRKQAEFDRLMTAASVYRRRGDYGQAEQAIRMRRAVLGDPAVVGLEARPLVVEIGVVA